MNKNLSLGLLVLATCAWSAIALAGGEVFDDINVVPVPEPATLVLLATGIAGVFVARLRKRK